MRHAPGSVRLASKHPSTFTARSSQDVDDSVVVGAVLPFSELEPPDEESLAVLEVDEAAFFDDDVLVPDDSVGSALRESLR